MWQERLVIVLVHFLWQGALIAVLLALLDSSLRRQKPSVRYTASLITFTVMSLCPLITWCFVSVPNNTPGQSMVPQPLVERVASEPAVPQQIAESHSSTSAPFDQQQTETDRLAVAITTNPGDRKSVV